MCVRSKDGTAACWGDNRKGQLGDGTATSRTEPAPVTGAADVVEIDAGGDHSCARRSSGKVECWGDNAQGELGDGTTVDRSAPTAVSWD